MFDQIAYPYLCKIPNPAPQATKKNKKNTRRVKAASEGLEGLMDWTNLRVSELTKEREAEMSSLAVGFAARMCK